MTITRQIYDTTALLGVMRELEPVQDYWLSLAFGSQINFDDEYIDFSKISENRKIAPLVVPTTQGRPIYSQAEKVYRLKPGYVKPKDVVSGAHMIRKRAGLGELILPTALTPQERYDATISEILRTHRDAIARRWEWMAAEALLNGSIVLEDDGYPKATVDFERNAGHTITKGAGTRWGDSGVSIVKDIEDWAQLMRDAPFGGPPNRLTIGSSVWPVMRANADIKELMRNDLRQTSGTSFNFGPRDGLRVELMGRINQTLEVWVYSDYYHSADGTVVPFMDPRDVLLTGPAIDGVRCFGAIQDISAGFQPTEIFSKMWNENDPSATLVMSQSAPLMVPINPNATLKARVLA